MQIKSAINSRLDEPRPLMKSKSDIIPSLETHDLIFAYIDFITFNNFQEIFDCINLCHSAILFILSKPLS